MENDNPFATSMTQRDYFATRAMQALIELRTHIAPDECAERAYEYADAMLRAKKGIQAPVGHTFNPNQMTRILRGGRMIKRGDAVFESDFET